MKTASIIVIILLLSLNSHSQTLLSSHTLNAGGAFFESEDYKISSNIGEMSLVNTFFSTDYIVSNGVLQPLILKKGGTTFEQGFKIRVYPTITNNNRTFLETEIDRSIVIKSKMITALGQTISHKNIVIEPGKTLSIFDISSVSKGVYLFEVQAYETSGILLFKKTFTIQKF